MREFTDLDGRGWVAQVAAEDAGPDYKGRYHLVLAAADGHGEDVPLEDVRWNSERTGRRTLDTMSGTELRRRLRSALGRASAPVGAAPYRP